MESERITSIVRRVREPHHSPSGAADEDLTTGFLEERRSRRPKRPSRWIDMIVVRVMVLFSILISALGGPVTASAWSDDQTVNTAICTASLDQSWNNMRLNIISDGSGGAIITWHDGRNSATSGTDIYVQKVSSNGTTLWTGNGMPICTATADQMNPTLTSDGFGGAIITWVDGRNSAIRGTDIYAQRVSASGTPQWDADGVAICSAAGNQSNPTLTSDGFGGAIITWYDARVSASNSGIYAQRIDPWGTIIWAEDGVAVCTAADVQADPTIDADGSGGAIIAWRDSRNLATSGVDIYAQKLEASSGAPQWTSDGVAVCTATGTQQACSPVSDGSGGAIITWHDNRSGAYDIYSQRVDDASGAPQWTSDGVAVCAAAGTQQYPALVGDGSGGAIITWHDQRSGTLDIYAQKIHGDSSTWSTVNGVPICTAPGTQQYPALVSDGSGGAIIAWYDNQNGNFDIYAQRVDSEGAISWTGIGEAISTPAGTQRYPALTTDGSGGAIITWQDQRNGNWDVYAQKVKSDGTLPVPPTVTGVNPTLGDRGQTLTSVIITGANFSGTTSVSFGSQVTVDNFTVTSSISISADITIDAAADLGARDVSVATEDGVATLQNAFTIYPALLAGFSAGRTAVVTGQTIAFTDLSAGGAAPLSYQWDFDNDGFWDSTAQNPSHGYGAPGTYTVVLKVTDAAANADTETKVNFITVSDPIQADFSADRTAAVVGQTIAFTDLSAGGVTPLSYQWDFDNDGFWDSTAQNPSYGYGAPGAYTVVLKVTDAATNTDNETKVNFIAISDSVLADFSADRTAAVVGQTIAFTDLSAGGVTPLSYQWDFDNDGSWDSTDQNPSYGYGAPGAYTVVLKVTDAATNTDTETRVDFIAISDSVLADFSADRTAAVVGQMIAFTDFSAGGVTPLSYQWDFDNDGSWDSTTQNPSHSYGTPGTYTVVLKVTDAATNTDTETKVDFIAISDSVQADFSADSTAVIVGQSVSFTNLSTGGVAPLSYQWDFDNDGSWDSTTQNPTYAYASAGTYTVVLSVADDATNTDVEAKVSYISVSQAPPTVDTVTPDSGIQGQTLSETITGTDLTGATAVSFGSGIVVNSYTVDGDTQITASITIDGSAATGARDVQVTAPGGTATLADGFTVIMTPTDRWYEQYTSVGTIASGICAGFWPSQSFTPVASHNLNTVSFCLYKVGSPSYTITATLYAADSDDKPTGPPLCSTTFLASSLTTAARWYEYEFTTGCHVVAGTKYALVLSATGGSPGSMAYWRVNTAGTYSRGMKAVSADHGSTWTANPTHDFGFREGQNPPKWFEQCTTGAGAASGVYYAFWPSQTFTPVTSHTFNAVSAQLYKVGSPTYTVTISLYAAETDDRPTGLALASTTFLASTLTTTATWYEHQFPTGYAMTAGTKYAIVLSATGGSPGSMVYWRVNTAGTYSRGMKAVSADGGATWTTNPAQDFMFREGRDSRRWHEQYTSGANAASGVFNGSWLSQTFTPLTSHTLDAASLSLYRVGSPTYTVTVSLYVAGTEDRPAGSALASTTFLASSLTTTATWYEYQFASGYYVTAGTKYALVLSATSGDTGNIVYWQVNTAGTYSGGTKASSADQGVSWTGNPAQDFMFKEGQA